MEKEGASTEREGVIDAEEFDWLWNVLKDGAVFQQYRARPEDREVDVKANHVVGMGFEVEGEMGFLTHQVPVGERDEGFVSWLKVLSGTFR